MGLGFLKRIFKKVNIHNLKTKLMISLFLIFIFFIFSFVINSLVVSSMIRSKINSSVESSINSNNTYLTFLFTKAKDISNNLSVEMALNENIRKLFNNPEEIINPYLRYKSIDELTKKIMYLNQWSEYVESIYIYMDKTEQVVTSNYGVFQYKNLLRKEDLQQIHNIKNTYQWIGSNNDEISKKGISLMSRADIISRSIKSPVYISINFNENTIYNILSNLKITKNTMVFLLDSNNKIISTENKKELGSKIDDVIKINFNSSGNMMTNRIKLHNKVYYQSIYTKNLASNFTILVLLPEKELLVETRYFLFINITIFLIILIISLYFSSRIIDKQVDRPLKKIVTFMQQAEKGNFNNKIEENRLDEFGYLYGSYNVMIHKIKNLIQELYEEKLLKKEAEIKMLQKQINPHFLYNTLDSINWIAQSYNANNISEVVMALSNHYRTIFNRGSDFIQIGKMMDSLKDYLYICKFRYGEHLTYNMECDENINNQYVLNLLLQPIVENALIHGIDKTEGNGVIFIKCHKKNNLIKFIVKDNGKGMGEDKIKLVMASIKKTNSSSDSGLKNVNNRIRLYYGDEYGILIESSINEGTVVTITIPILENKELV